MTTETTKIVCNGCGEQYDNEPEQCNVCGLEEFERK